ncbi:hypothetical protein BHE74_00039034 [Ensete ventricosum]|nr:hypothetical protein BHE74_00039034 [Ensete ventricosum]
MSLPHSLPSICGYPIHIAFDLWGRPFSLFPFSLLHYSRAFQPYVIVVNRTSVAPPSPSPQPSVIVAPASNRHISLPASSSTVICSNRTWLRCHYHTTYLPPAATPSTLPSTYGEDLLASSLLFPFSLLYYSRAFQPYVIVVDRTSAATPSPTPPPSGSKTVAQPYLILLELERAIVIVPRPVDHWRTLVMLLPVAPSTLSSLPLLHWQ